MSNPETPTPPSSDAAKLMLFDAQKKSMLVAYLLLIFLGAFGAHRFYLGQTGSGAAMLIIFLVSLLLTVVVIGAVGLLVIGIWCFVDLFLIPGYVKKYNVNLALALK